MSGLMFTNNCVVFCKKNLSNKKPLVSSVKPKEKSFACIHLQLVKIKCSKDDARVHKLAHFFRTNGISDDKIFVRWTGSACKSYIFCISITVSMSFPRKKIKVL